MKLKTQITSEMEIDIPVPSFYKSKTNTDYVGILDEKTIVSFYFAPGFSLIKSGGSEILGNELVSAFLNYDKIDELEFCTKHIEVLESFSLEPKLIEKPKVKKYIVQDREAGNYINSYDTLQQAQNAVMYFEKSDVENENFTPDFYEIKEVS